MALPANSAVSITTMEGKSEFVLSPLERLDAPASLLAPRDKVAALLPRVDLPELLLEVPPMGQRVTAQRRVGLQQFEDRQYARGWWYIFILHGNSK